MPKDSVGTRVVDRDIPNQVRTDIKEVRIQCPASNVMKSFVKGVREGVEAGLAIFLPNVA
jgi:hypothetical protein